MSSPTSRCSGRRFAPLLSANLVGQIGRLAEADAFGPRRKYSEGCTTIPHAARNPYASPTIRALHTRSTASRSRLTRSLSTWSSSAVMRYFRLYRASMYARRRS
jgi:hypothetical protein